MSAAAAEAVQTSEQERDLFGAAPSPDPRSARRPSAASAQLHLTGVLSHSADVRMKAIDGAHFVPVVCIDLEDVGAGHHRLHAEQPFTDATRGQAEALAKSLRKGMRVSVSSALCDVRLSLPASTISATTEKE